MLARLFGVDVRALAALRIGLALLILVDLLFRSRDLTAHYTDAGIIPRAVLEQPFLYSLGGSTAFAGAMFALTAVFGLALLVGFWSWIATVGCWLLVAALVARSLTLNNGGDHLFVLLLFWSLFVPLGAAASLDRRAGRAGAEVPRVVLSAGSVGLLLQVVFVYLFTALLKTDPCWWRDGTAVYYALSLDMFVTPLGRALLGLPAPLLKAATHATYWLELVGWAVAFVPFRNAVLRTGIALTFIAFHLGLALAMNLAVFPWVCMLAWLPFLPSEFWDRLGWRAPSGATSAPDRRWLAAWPFGTPEPGLLHAFPALSLAVITYTNLGSVWGPVMHTALYRRLQDDMLVGQNWAMFTPGPPLNDGWWIAPARLDDGSEVDLRTAAPVDRSKPYGAGDPAPPARWRKFLFSLSFVENRRLGASYAAWLRRRWEAAQPPERRVESMRLVFIIERTQPEGAPPLIDEHVLHEWP